MFYKLPPAGDPIELHAVSSPADVLRQFFGDYVPRFYGSGTSALAGALIAATKLRPKQESEVLIPAYTCPAVVSAALFAGVRPVLVDFEPNRPWMDLADLQHKISRQTVAVVAVHLFGIPERLPMLREITKQNDIFLIEDSAQYLPMPGRAAWQGDFVVLSFGRGKPATLLGGGVVLTANLTLRHSLPTAQHRRLIPQFVSLMGSRLKVWGYNSFLSPYLYWLPALLPFLHLGETTFVPLNIITPATETMDGLAGVLEAYGRRSQGDAENMISRMLSTLKSDIIVDLPVLCCGSNIHKLVRYPLLVLDRELRNHCLQSLNAAGLGATAMYPCILPKLTGLEDLFKDSPSVPNAGAFANNILTLPTHSGVSSVHIEKMVNIVKKALPEGDIINVC